jgi:DSF synthase
MTNAIRKPQLALVDSGGSCFTQLSTFYDEKYQLIWYYMHAAPRPSFTPTLLDELRRFHTQTAAEINDPKGRNVRYMTLASDVPGVFNLGGDLDLFRRLIETQSRDGLRHYAKACIDALYGNVSHLDRDVTTISLVQGDALGGGFEAAMSSDVLIAERSSKMGLPEILFNLFPGMGAYSLLSRKLDGARAERMILSGRIYSAEELFEMGVVDVLAEDLQGEMAVYDYIRREERASNGYRALRAAKNRTNPITYRELMDIADIWVSAALRLQPRDLRMMDRLIARQSVRSRDAAKSL